jgi:hypothetical protein
MSGGFEVEFTDAPNGVRAGKFLEILAPLVPKYGRLLEGQFDGLGNFPVPLDNRAEVEFFDERGVAFVLAGDDLIDNDRAARM